ncbi:MAG: alpha/beta hydrolase family protein, partial [Planctomycetota bacterium]
MSRNFSIHDHFQHVAAAHCPEYRFDGNNREDWSAWRAELLPQLKDRLGSLPDKVPLRPDVVVEWEEGGLIKQRVVFDVEKGLSVPAYVFRPTEGRGPFPGILACHGHGPYGKDSVMGTAAAAEGGTGRSAHKNAYGLEMARSGFAVIAIDWRGFGERDDRGKPHWRNYAGDRDLCNLHFLRASLLGQTMLGLNVHDGMCALDYLCGLDYVDETRIGAMGLSLGGTMTTWMSIMDERIRAADIICYSDRFADFAMRDCNFCGNQMLPKLYALCDVPDLQGLIAPRPLLVEIGVHDQCFLVDSAKSCFDELVKIYEACGADDLLELDLFEGEHRW